MKALTSLKKGNIVATLLFVIVLAILGVSYMSFVIFEAKKTSRSYKSTVAMNVAEAGVEIAMREFNHGGWNFTSADGWRGTEPATKTGILNASDGTPVGEYVVEVRGYTTDKRYPKVRATGYVPNRSNAEVQRTVSVWLKNTLNIPGRCIVTAWQER